MALLSATLIRIMRVATLVLVLSASQVAMAAPPTTCGAKDDYSRALCAYQHRNFAAAESGFKAIAEDHDNPKAIPAMYFLARSEMKQGRYDEASILFVRIYEVAPPFFREWNCEFLLGECRKALGKG
jgi:TolA-binding protein